MCKNVKLMKGDCLELMKEIPDGSVDMILCDPPYGTMKGAGLDGWDKDDTLWDERLDTGRLFAEYERILRESGICILFSQEPYTSELRTQRTANFDFIYPMIWKKDHFANALIAKKAPVSYFEDITVFAKKYDRQCVNPLRRYFGEVMRYIGVKGVKDINKELGHRRAEHVFYIDTMQFGLCTPKTYQELIDRFGIDKMPGFMEFKECESMAKRYWRVFNLPHGCRFTGNVLDFKKDYQGLHPTQKPVALLEHLVRLYTNPDDVVLDNCMGSGSTGVACVNTGRKFIGMELDGNYFEIAQKRIAEAESAIAKMDGGGDDK
jgi:site-specific DNA-methyltransferase (adenine-specific)